MCGFNRDDHGDGSFGRVLGWDGTVFWCGRNGEHGKAKRTLGIWEAVRLLRSSLAAIITTVRACVLWKSFWAKMLHPFVLAMYFWGDTLVMNVH